MRSILIIILILFIIYKMKETKEVNIGYSQQNKQFDLDEKTINKTFKSSFWLAITSLIFFLLIIIIFSITFIGVGLSTNPAAGWALIAVFFLFIYLFAFMIIFNVISNKLINKYKQHNISAPIKTQKLIKFNSLQIPIIVVVIVLGFILMSHLSDKTDLVMKMIEDKYGKEYKILYKDHISNEGGTNEYIFVVYLENMDFVLSVNYDVINDNYEDNYDDVLKAEKTNYSQNIKSIFKEDVLSYMEVYDNYDGHECASLVLIMEKDILENREVFLNKIEKVLDLYGKDYDNFWLNIYLTDEIKSNLEHEYNVLSVASGIVELEEEYSYLYKSHKRFYTYNYGQYDDDELYNKIFNWN